MLAEHERWAQESFARISAFLAPLKDMRTNILPNPWLASSRVDADDRGKPHPRQAGAVCRVLDDERPYPRSICFRVNHRVAFFRVTCSLIIYAQIPR
jgi:hypothetical protein